jgi:hypothetical protein
VAAADIDGAKRCCPKKTATGAGVECHPPKMRIAGVLLVCVLASAALADSRTITFSTNVPRTQRTLELGTHEGVSWPIVNAPIDGPLPAAPVATDAAPPPPTKAGARVLAVVDAIRDSLVDTSYQAATKVDVETGSYKWDCSGMTTWILRRAAPVAWKSLHSSRPVARDFAAAIERSPATRAKAGWQRIAKIADVMPGDVFAWRRPRGMPSKNTGHVGIVLGKPLPVPEIPNAWAVRIADSTRGYHQDDVRATDDDGGFGIGTLVFLTDDTGRATHYGWSGTQSEFYIVTNVVFGRVSK